MTASPCPPTQGRGKVWLVLAPKGYGPGLTSAVRTPNVEGTGSSRPSAMPRIVLRSILTDRVFGSPCTTDTSGNAATGPMSRRTAATSSLRSVSSSMLTRS